MNKEETEKLRKEINSHKLYISPLELIDRDVLLGLLERVDVLEAQNKELVRTLKPLVERCRYIWDKGPEDEGWQSEILIEEIAAADAAMAASEVK